MAPLLAGAAYPQAQPPPVPAQATVFRAEVDYVEVEAFVTDEGGKVVSGLSRDDFQVFEEGARQEIAVFAEIRIPIDRTEATPPERARSTQDVATNEEGIRGRVFAIVLDELHTDARRSGEVRKLVREFVERHMARNDVAAVVSTGGRADATLGFTGDRPRLLEAVERFAGRKSRSATLERLDTVERQRDLLRAEPDTRNAPPPPELQLAPRPAWSGIPRTSSAFTTPARRWQPWSAQRAASAAWTAAARRSCGSAKASTTTRSTSWARPSATPPRSYRA